VKTLKISLLALVSALSLAACDREGALGPGGLREGRFDGEITGALDGRITGDALSGSTEAQWHDLIVLTDFASGLEVTVWHLDAEFFEGSHRIGDGFEDEVVASVEVLDTGEFFDSVEGTVVIDDEDGNGVRGTLRFTAESDRFAGDFVTVDVDFNTDFDPDLDLNLSPRLNVSATATRK
jgi:hypothetical protein